MGGRRRNAIRQRRYRPLARPGGGGAGCRHRDDGSHRTRHHVEDCRGLRELGETRRQATESHIIGVIVVVPDSNVGAKCCIGALMIAAASNIPGRWRRRAQEARADAERHVDPDTKKALLDIAALYEQLAVSAEKKPTV